MEAVYALAGCIFLYCVVRAAYAAGKSDQRWEEIERSIAARKRRE